MATINAGAIRVTIGADTKPLEEARKKTDREFKTIEKSMDRLRGVALKLGAALAAAFTVRALVDAGQKAIDTMAQMQRLSEAMGITVEKFSALAYAAQQTGSSMEDFTGAARSLNRVMQEAIGDPLSRGAEAFRTLGISITDSQGKMRSVDEVLLDLSDRFAGFEDGANKTAIAMQLFGDAGTKLIPMLNRGSAGIREMEEQARKLGFTVDEQAGKSAVRFQEQLNRLNSTFQGIVNRVIQNVLPQMERLAEIFEDVKNDTDRLNSAVKTGELIWKALAATLVLVAGAMLSVLEGARGLKNFFSEPFTGNWDADIDRLASDFRGLLDVLDMVKKSLDVILLQGNEALEAAGRIPGFAAPGLLGGDDEGKSDAPRIRSAGEISKEMEALRGELDLVLDRLNGLPNMIGEAYTINVTSFENAIAAIDKAVMKGVLTQQQATRMKLQLTEQEQNAYKQTAQVAAQAITTLFPKSKAAAVAAAIINTAVAVTEALKLPPPLNFVQAGLVAAAGAAQVATIMSTNMNGGGSRPSLSGGGASTGSSVSQAPAAPVVPEITEPERRPGTVHKVELVGMGDLMTRDVFENLMEQIIEWQRDGGTVVLERA